MEKGYLAIVLHAHLPFVRHPEHASFLEEDWLYEALTECYIPLLRMMGGLERDGIDFRLTLSLSPPLLAMLTDPLLQSRYVAKLNRLLEFCDRERERTRGQPECNLLAEHYYRTFTETREVFEKQYGRNLVGAFAYFYSRGNLELITSAATHAFLPLMDRNRAAVKAQVRIGVEYFTGLFGSAPRGIWLPECGYEPGLDSILSECGIEYFFVEAHGILNGAPRPKYGVFAPIRCPSGVAAFGRDLDSSKQVWSAHYGYPGDPAYRDFYRDAGFDLDYEYIKPYLHPDGKRTYTGLKYHRITGGPGEKQLYRPDEARSRAAVHARDFIAGRQAQIAYLNDFLGRSPVIVSPFDAELFGHWWYEGPQWLDCVIRTAASTQTPCCMITPSEYLDAFPDIQAAQPCLSSWGWQGYNEAWLDECNDWIYRHLHKAAEMMVTLAGRMPDARGSRLRALNQAARELLLAQSSDWAFIMKTGTMAEYAVRRSKMHLANFFRLHEALLQDCLDDGWLGELESRHNIFPDIDYRIYRNTD